MADWAQFVRAGGMGADAMKPGQRPARELIDYHNRMAHAHEHGASIPAYSGIHYSLAEVSLDRPRDAKALSVYVPGARQTYGLGYEETLAAAAVQTATGNTPAALEWPVPFGSRDRAVEGYTGHVPLADSMLGLTTAERVRLSERRLAEGHLFHPHRDVRHEPAAQPHAGFPYAAEQVEGLAAQRQRLVDTRQQSAKQRAETLRHAVAVLSSRPGSAAAGRPSGPRVHSREVSRLVFDEGERGEQLGPREVRTPTFVTAAAPALSTLGASRMAHAFAPVLAGAAAGPTASFQPAAARPQDALRGAHAHATPARAAAMHARPASASVHTQTVAETAALQRSLARPRDAPHGSGWQTAAPATAALEHPRPTQAPMPPPQGRISRQGEQARPRHPSHHEFSRGHGPATALPRQASPRSASSLAVGAARDAGTRGSAAFGHARQVRRTDQDAPAFRQ